MILLNDCPTVCDIEVIVDQRSKPNAHSEKNRFKLLRNLATGQGAWRINNPCHFTRYAALMDNTYFYWHGTWGSYCISKSQLKNKTLITKMLYYLNFDHINSIRCNMKHQINHICCIIQSWLIKVYLKLLHWHHATAAV